ncbi:MAG: ABC transporter permease [Lachnospirales bacterium]
MNFKKYIKKEYISTLLSLPILILIWHLIHIKLNSKIVPSPFEVFLNIPEVLQDADTSINITSSVKRILISILISVVFGTTIGVAMAFNKWVDRLLSPIIYLTYPIPKLALLPIIILIFGLGEISKIIMIVSILIFQIITSVRGAVLDVPKSSYTYFKILGIGKVKTFWHIVTPTIIKQLFVTLKIATGTAISVLFFTETYGTKYGGLGYYIMDMFQMANYVNMYTGILLLSILGFVIFISLDILERIITPWNIK